MDVAMGLKSSDGAATELMAPPDTALPLASGALLAGLVLLLAYVAGRSVGNILAPTVSGRVGAVAGVASLLLTCPSLWLAARRRADSRSRWHDGDVVSARRLAAASRNYAFVAMGITTFLVPMLALVIFVSANGGAVQKTFLRFDLIFGSFVDIARALRINLLIAISAELISIVFGLVLTVGRLAPGRSFMLVRAFSIGYIDIFRGLPAIVVIYLVCFGLPLTNLPLVSNGQPMVYAIIALSITYAAYNAELFRAGIETIHASQVSAAQSLGLSAFDVFRFVVLPQATRRIAPALLSNFISLQKDTALVNIVGVVDAFTQAKIYSANYYNLSAVTVVCMLFIFITIPQTRLVDYLIARGKAK